MSDISVTIDLSTAEAKADRARALLRDLRARHDLARFEFTRQVRIAPHEIPHSHPVLTLNTFVIDDEAAFLGTYLHEQIHWYLTDHRDREVARAVATLRQRYPDVPSPESQNARDTYSIYLHLVVNWLEIEALAHLLGRSAALHLYEAPRVYPWIYATAIRDRQPIGALLTETGIAPMPDARSLSKCPGTTSP